MPEEVIYAHLESNEGRKENVMSYESRLYIVDKTKLTEVINGKEMRWGEVISVFNLCNASAVGEKMRKYPETDVFIYADDGNTIILEDSYGDALKEIPIHEAIKIIEEAASKDKYRRYVPCINMLKGFELSKWSNLVVLHYGY